MASNDKRQQVEKKVDPTVKIFHLGGYDVILALYEGGGVSVAWGGLCLYITSSLPKKGARCVAKGGRWLPKGGSDL